MDCYGQEKNENGAQYRREMTARFKRKYGAVVK